MFCVSMNLWTIQLIGVPIPSQQNQPFKLFACWRTHVHSPHTRMNVVYTLGPIKKNKQKGERKRHNKKNNNVLRVRAAAVATATTTTARDERKEGWILMLRLVSLGLHIISNIIYASHALFPSPLSRMRSMLVSVMREHTHNMLFIYAEQANERRTKQKQKKTHQQASQQ